MPLLTCGTLHFADPISAKDSIGDWINFTNYLIGKYQIVGKLICT